MDDKIVDAGIVNVAEATQVRNHKFREISELLQGVSKGIHQLISTMVNKNNQVTLNRLNEIKEIIEELQYDLHQKKPEDLPKLDLGSRMESVIALFDRIDDDVRLSTASIMAETNAVLAYSGIRHLTDAQSIIDDPGKAHHTDLNWTFHGEQERIAAEVRTRFPTFLGHRVSVADVASGFRIILKDRPGQNTGREDYRAKLKQLLPKVAEIIEWGSRKTGFHLVYNIAIGYDVLICEIKPKP
jgi:hypothetical protein